MLHQSFSNVYKPFLFLCPPKTATWSLSLIFLSVCVVIPFLQLPLYPHDQNYWPYPRTTVKQSGSIRCLLSGLNLFCTFFKPRIMYAIRGYLNFNSRIIYAIRGYFNSKSRIIYAIKGYFSSKTMLIYAFWG